MVDYGKVIQAAEVALREGRVAEAHRLLHWVVERDAGNGRAWFLLSVLADAAAPREMYRAKALAAGFDPAQVAPGAAPFQSSPAQAKAAPNSAGSAFFKGGCFLVLGMLAVGICAVVSGGGFAIDLGGIACLFVVGGALGAIFYAVQKK